MSEFDRVCATAAAPHAPSDLTGRAAEQIEQALDDEGERVAAITDDRQREMAEAKLNARWRDYLLAWHAAADSCGALT